MSETEDVAPNLDLSMVSREALEELARAVIDFDDGPGFPGGPLADALDRVRAELARREQKP